MPLDVEAPVTPIARTLKSLEAFAPHAVRERVAQVRRDLAVVEARLVTGEKPDPLVRSHAKRDVKPVPRVSVVPAPVVTADTPDVPVVIAPRVDVPPSRLSEGGAPQTAKAKAASMTLHSEAGSVTFDVGPGQTLLEAGLNAGAPLRFSCTLGGCGTCKVRLVEGEIDLVEPHCLTPVELAEGLRLTCVGHAASPRVVARLEPENEA